MKIPAFTPASAAMLLLGVALTTQSSAAPWKDPTTRNYTFGRQELVLTDTGTIEIGNKLAGTTAIAPPDARPSGALILAGIAEYSGKARHNMYEAFSELPRLTMVPTELAVGFDEEGEGQGGGDEGFEWTRFEREPATRPNQFMARFWKALLYVCHIITVDHIRALRFGRGSQRFGRYRYRYRLGNPNSMKNRRLRCISRLIVNIDRMLWDAGSQMMGFLLLLIVGRRGESVESRASPRNLFPPAPSAAASVATRLLGYYAAAAAATAAAAQRLTLRTVLRVIIRAVALFGLITSPLTGPFCFQLSKRLGRQLLKSIVKLLSKRVTKLLVKRLLVLLSSESRAAAPVPRGAPPAAPVLLTPPSAAPCTISAAAPLRVEQPAAPRLMGAPAPLSVILPAAPLRMLPAGVLPVRSASVPLRILPVAPMLKQATAPLLLDPPAATLMLASGAARLEIPAASTVLGVAKPLQPTVSPRLIIPAFLRFILPAAAPQLEPPPAPFPPALLGVQLPRAPEMEAAAHSEAVRWSSVAKTFVVMDLYESDSMKTPERSLGDALKAGGDGLAEACCPSERVAVRWISVEAVELHLFSGHAQGSEHAALAIFSGMISDKNAVLGVVVMWASPPGWLQRSTIKGQRLQLQRGLGNSREVLRRQSPTAHTWLGDEAVVALHENLFTSAVFSLSTRQGLLKYAVHSLIQTTLETGNNGPVVSLWVVHSLLDNAESDSKRNRDATPDSTCIQSRLVSAGRKLKTFNDLDRHAPMALSSFVNGYQAAVFGQVR